MTRITSKISLMALLVITISIGLPSAFATSHTSESLEVEEIKCLDAFNEKIKQNEKANKGLESALEKIKSNKMFKNILKNKAFEHYGTTQTWNINEDCESALFSNNLVYSSTDENGEDMIVEVEINAKTSKIIKIDKKLKKHMVTHGVLQTANWAGYEFHGNSGATEEVLKSSIRYDVPTPNDPSGFNCGTSLSTQCYASLWTGLATDDDGTPMVQAGTDSICKGSGCSTERDYVGWIEKLSSSGYSTSYPCSSTWNSSLDAGDDVWSQVTNDEITTSSDSSYYDALVWNLTDNIICNKLNVYSSSNPTYGLYVYERPSVGSTITKLAQITDVSDIYSTIYYDGELRSIDDPYSNGWYTNYEMWSDIDGTLTKNADSAKQSEMYLTFDWITSDGTN